MKMAIKDKEPFRVAKEYMDINKLVAENIKLDISIHPTLFSCLHGTLSEDIADSQVMKIF